MLVLLAGCNQSYEASKQQRMRLAANPKNKAPVLIGVPWRNADEDLYIAGVKLAVKEINEKGGVLDHIPLEIIVNDGESEFYNQDLSERARRNVILNIANGFATNPNVIAVVGHATSEIAMIASVVYQNRGVLFIAPNAKYGKLTGHNFAYTFRGTLNNEITGRQLADYSGQKNYKHIAVLYARGDSTEELVNAFTTRGVEKDGINIVFRRSFFETTVDIISLVSDLKSIQNVDAIFLAASSHLSPEIYQEIRNVGIKLPIIGTETFDDKEFLKLIKEWEFVKTIEKSNIPTVFNSSTPHGERFVKLFKKEYGQEAQPDYLAALGYDSINMLAYGIQYAHSKVPIEIATALRFMEQPCMGAAGKYEFELSGDLKTKPLSIKYFSKNHFVFEQVDKGLESQEATLYACNDVDRDHDGIQNSFDACPDNTPEEIAKGVFQDGAERGCPVDTDKDGVPDYRDSCPNNTPAEIIDGVDEKGCPVDYDKDGIPDFKDPDVDNDNVPNEIDKCLKNTIKELEFGVNLTGKQAGCQVDTDGDSVMDYVDSCRTNTAEEISKGVDASGCPVDLDFDGVLDYQDNCPKTPEDILVDVTGCEALNVMTSLKPEAFLFVKRKPALSKTGEKYLNDLVTNSHLELLKKIQLIGYATPQNKALFQKRLEAMVSFLQQKTIPIEKIEIAVQDIDIVAKKKNVVEFIFSEVKMKSDELETETGAENAPAKPGAGTTEIPAKAPEKATTTNTQDRPDASAAQIPSKPPEKATANTTVKPNSSAAEIPAKPSETSTAGTKAKPDASATETPTETGTANTKAKPDASAAKIPAKPKSSTSATRPSH